LGPRQLAAAREILGELGVHAARAYGGDESTVPGRMRALGLSEREALGAVGAFVLTGTETIVSFLPRMVALLVDSGWHACVAAEPALVDAVIAEGLRVTTPSPVMLRAVARATAVGSVAVRPGDRIILGTYWADTALGVFDPVGNPAASLKQLWFGAGAHFCLGAPLAMAQLRLALDALLAHPGLSIVRRRPARGVLIPSYAELRVRARAAAPACPPASPAREPSRLASRPPSRLEEPSHPSQGVGQPDGPHPPHWSTCVTPSP